MSLIIDKQKVYITAGRVPSLLNELKTAYPDITDLNYESPAHNLQLLFYHLGYHTRIMIIGSIFTISAIDKKAESNMLDVFNILSKYLESDGIIVVTLDGNTYTFTNTGCVNVITEQKQEEISSEDSTFIEEEIEDSLIDNVVNVTESDILSTICETKNEEIKSESVIDSNVVKKKKGGRPRKST